MPNWFERNKKRHPLVALIVGGILLFLDNVGRLQVLRDVYDRIKIVWTSIHLAWPGHLLTWVGGAIAIYGFASLAWPSKETTANSKEVEDALPKALPMSKLVPGRIFVGPNITLPYLSSLCEGKPAIQARKLCEPFIDKWIRVSGEVNNVRDDLGLVVVLDGPSGFVGCRFEEDKWKDRVSMLRLRDKIMVTGKIRSIERHSIWLYECELDD